MKVDAGYTTSVRFLYFGLPLGAEVLRRHGHIPVVASFGHLDMPGRRRARERIATTLVDPGVSSERPLLLGKPDLNDEVIVQTLAGARPDAILSWFWPQRIPARVLDLVQGPKGRRAFGVHPSLLPRHRGPDPTFHAIKAGDLETGVTLHRLDAEYDTGDIIAQRRVTISPTENSFQLAKRLDRPSLALLVECADRLARGEELEGAAQDIRLATQAELPTEDDLAIDWQGSVEDVLRLVRAASPAPLAAAMLGEELVLIVRAKRYEGKVPPVLEAGEAMQVPEGIVVVCADGGVLIEEVEDEDGEHIVGEDIGELVS
jgi:methionyl-tRNA formyltransferase